ncbi:MAG: 2OG-Fe(II) oxygenase [Acidobacteriota bacterium]|nr:2OG-Fe(II) oxygenase [Acidobacteriota bacterium]
MSDVLSKLNITDRLDEIRDQWMAAKPFGYVVIDNFLKPEIAETILSQYPTPDSDIWSLTSYIHQRRKLELQSGFPGAINDFFRLTEAEEFLDLITYICGIPKLLPDPELIGGGLHQILDGGFLDVHIDYNFHPKTKLHRRLNLLLYLNKDWQPEYEGYLELWNMEEDKRIANVAPLFNRAVIFETNEVSYHGFPHPLKVPPGVTRKSLAVYYYTEERDAAEVAPEHNTIYKQTTGVKGYIKTSASAIEALSERLSSDKNESVVKNIVNKTFRKIKRLPPENK